MVPFVNTLTYIPTLNNSEYDYVLLVEEQEQEISSEIFNFLGGTQEALPKLSQVSRYTS
jgi:hypothetical protein